jgi:hypothetical protein
MDGHPALRVTECALGKWYFGDGRYFAGSAMYMAIDAPHRSLHDVGERIVSGIRAGADLRHIAPLLDELKQASTALLMQLEDLEDLGLRALHNSTSA